jgi:hypothetical protein
MFTVIMVYEIKKIIPIPIMSLVLIFFMAAGLN